MKKLFSTLMLTILASASAMAGDSLAVSMVKYVQNWNDVDGTLSLRNNTAERIRNVRFRLTYYDLELNQLDYRDYSKNVNIEPGMTRQVEVPAYEHRRSYAYYQSKKLESATVFKIRFRLLGYNTGQISQEKPAGSQADESMIPEPFTMNIVERVADEPVGVSGKSSDKDRVYDVVEQMPHFPGGGAALMKYLNENINYPSVAQENGVQGRVVISFVVERDGSITDVKVARSVDPSLDREATRVVQSMPHWIPGKQNGSAVRVKYMMPVSFRLSDNVNRMKKDDIQRFDDVFRQ